LLELSVHVRVMLFVPDVAFRLVGATSAALAESGIAANRPDTSANASIVDNSRFDLLFI